MDISLQDVSCVVRLVREVCDRWDDPRAWREHLLQGACRLLKGNVGADSIAFDFGNAGAYHFTGTFTASRMIGTFVITEFPQSGHFILNRQ